MIDKEKNIKRYERRIEDYKCELSLMEKDYLTVRSRRSRQLLEDDIHRVKRLIENLEFKMWKLSK